MSRRSLARGRRPLRLAALGTGRECSRSGLPHFRARRPRPAARIVAIDSHTDDDTALPLSPRRRRRRPVGSLLRPRSPLRPAGAWIALAPLVLLLSAPRPGRLGWVHGYAAWMTGLYWIVPTLQTYGGIAAAARDRADQPARRLPRPLPRRLRLARGAHLAPVGHRRACSSCRRSGWRSNGCAPISAAASPGTSPATPGWTCRAPCRSRRWIGAYGISFLVGARQRRRWPPRSSARRWEPAAVGLLVPLLLLPLAGRWSLRQDGLALRETPAASAAPCACCSRTSPTSSPTTRRR